MKDPRKSHPLQAPPSPSLANSMEATKRKRSLRKQAQTAVFALVTGTITFLVIDKIFLESVQESVGVISWLSLIIVALNVGICFFLASQRVSINRMSLGYLGFWFASGFAAGVFDENVTSPISIGSVILITSVLWYVLLKD